MDINDHRNYEIAYYKQNVENKHYKNLCMSCDYSYVVNTIKMLQYSDFFISKI